MQTPDTLAYLISQGFSEAVLQRFWSKVEKSEGCWLWIGAHLPSPGSYGLWNPNSKWNHSRLTHRISWIIHFGPIPDGLDVLHSCDCPPCVRGDHLFLGTDLDNMRDKHAKGRGYYPGARKLSEEQASEIKRIGHSESLRQLARRFNISEGVISDIRAGRTWGHIS